jgi:exonuclease SbcC
MSLRIAHLADIHYSRERKNDVLTALRTVKDNVEKNAVDMIAIAGDIFDSAMLNSANTGFPELLDAIKELADAAPVCLVYGTPSHDVDSCLDVFPKLTAKHGITILEPGQAYFYTAVPGENYPRGIYTYPAAPSCRDKNKAILFGIPEPRRKFLLADNTTGKDETEESIRAAVRRMCFLLAAKRMEYPDIPCALLYHGDVAGSTLQNDQNVERGTGISITIDDLNDIGADYACLGHIHKPQQVGNLPAYYAGSLIPKNFGETHKAGFNLVTVDKGKAEVNRIDIDYPQNLKIETSGSASCKIPPGGISGKRVWLEITCSKEQRALINADKELARLRELGAVEGSRVTLSDIPVETVRAAEITAVNTPEKKFEVWAENSNVEFADGCLTKIKSLDAEIAQGAAGAAGAAGEWELASLRIKGAVGIMKGVKKEEISVNFDRFDSGLIALTGANGKGKTTLIENCHPYPQLLTRKGKLQDHFFLKDSLREVVYRNRADGSMRKFLIQIDGQNKSGSCKHFIFKQTAGLADAEWEPLPGVDGNLKPYEEALEAVFGPIDLFQRTAFITQRPTKNLPDLTDATAGEKKALFAALAGIDYLQGFSDAAGGKAKLETAKAHDAEIKMQVLQEAVDKKPQAARALKDSEAALAAEETELTGITKQGKAAKADVERLQAAWNTEQVRRSREDEAAAAVDAVREEIRNLAFDIDALTEAAGNKPRCEKDAAEYEALQKVIDAENVRKQGHTEAELKKQQDYAEVKAAYDESIKDVEAERDNLYDEHNSRDRLVEKAEYNINRAEIEEEFECDRLCKPLTGRKAEIDRQISATENRIKLYERDAAEITEDCPTCGRKLPEGKLAELKAKRGEYIQKIDSEKKAVEALNAEITDIERKICGAVQKAAEQRGAKTAEERAEIQKQQEKIAEINKRIGELDQQLSELAFDEPEKPEVKPFDDAALNAALAGRRRIDIVQTRAALTRAQEAAVRIDGLKKQTAEKTKLLKDKEAEYAKIRQSPEIGLKIKTDLDAAISRHTELAEKYTAVKAEIAGTEAGIEAVKKTLAEIAEKEKEYSALNTAVQGAAQEGREWELIARAFGRDGIQALELDALAPGISDTANRILESAYGDRFKIVIETTRMGGAGKKIKQIEDFVIKVIDSEDGEAVNLEDKSGGEAVWIKRAIYDAFAVIRKRNTAFAFLTCFQDETDGALDAAAKTAYCRMLEAAHAESKLRHTVIITHSNEVKAMIDQKIDMEELAAAV